MNQVFVAMLAGVCTQTHPKIWRQRRGQRNRIIQELYSAFLRALSCRCGFLLFCPLLSMAAFLSTRVYVCAQYCRHLCNSLNCVNSLQVKSCSLSFLVFVSVDNYNYLKRPPTAPYVRHGLKSYN